MANSVFVLPHVLGTASLPVTITIEGERVIVSNARHVTVEVPFSTKHGGLFFTGANVDKPNDAIMFHISSHKMDELDLKIGKKSESTEKTFLAPSFAFSEIQIRQGGTQEDPTLQIKAVTKPKDWDQGLHNTRRYVLEDTSLGIKKDPKQEEVLA
jgi:hypothetical protein